MKRLLIMLAAICLYACAASVTQPVAQSAPKPVVILGNRTQPSFCECPDATREHRRAERWKAYAEKLEAQLGIARGHHP